MHVHVVSWDSLRCDRFSTLALRLIARRNGALTFDGDPADADLAALTEGAQPTTPPDAD